MAPSLTAVIVRIGPPQLLICLFGTLQCGVHNIPLEVWLPRGYPRDAPLLFIQPSPGIMIRPTANVDATGRVFHPMLGGWRPELATVEVLRMLTGVLAMDPPFFPGSGRPVYANSASGGPIAHPMTANPTMRPTNSSSMGQPYHHPAMGPITPPMGHHPAMSPPQYGYGSPSLSPAPTPKSAVTPTATPAAAPSATVTKEDMPQLRILLKSKLNHRYHQIQRELALESDRLLAESTQLTMGEKTLEEGRQRVRDELTKTQDEIDAIKAQTHRLVSLAQGGSGVINYDNLVVPHGPIARQIMELVAEDLAIQDTIYAISKAFLDGRASFGLIVYLRHVRDLARDQFMAKALLAKIRREFPLINN